MAVSTLHVPFLDVGAAYKELKDPLDEAVARVMASGRYVMGEEVERFEQQFADYIGADHCVSVGNGLDALILSLKALEIGEGDEVIVPANTYIATWLAVSATGATPVPVEPVTDGCNIDSDLIAQHITPRTRAILPVHLCGHPARMENILDIAAQKGLPVIDDCAQAHGAEQGGVRLGKTSTAGAFSFYPGKNLGAMGDGGAVVTSDPVLAEKLRLLRNYGSAEKYQHERLGVNSRLDPIQAAVLSVKLGYLDEWNSRRAAVAERYLDAFAGLPVRMMKPETGDKSSWHLFALLTEKRDELAGYLAEQGVETLIHYPVAPHHSGAYRGEFDLALPLTEMFAEQTLSLPMGPHLPDDGQSHVIASVRAFFKDE